MIINTSSIIAIAINAPAPNSASKPVSAPKITPKMKANKFRQKY